MTVKDDCLDFIAVMEIFELLSWKKKQTHVNTHSHISIRTPLCTQRTLRGCCSNHFGTCGGVMHLTMSRKHKEAMTSGQALCRCVCVCVCVCLGVCVCVCLYIPESVAAAFPLTPPPLPTSDAAVTSEGLALLGTLTTACPAPLPSC